MLSVDSMPNIRTERRRRCTYRIPSLRSRKPLGSATRIVPPCDVVERVLRVRVQQRVQEPKRLPAVSEDRVVQQRNHARDRGARCARAGDGYGLPATDDLEALRLGGDVGERAPARVEKALVRVAKAFEVGRDGVILVLRARERVREAACGERDADFWTKAVRAADGRYARSCALLCE